MSRITRAPVQDGDNVTALNLNARFNDYSQAGALNAFNVRDAAIDLPHFTPGRFMAPQMASGVIGFSDWKHGTYNTDLAVAGVQPPFLVRNAAGTATPLALGTGWTLDGDHVLRVYWDLSVRPVYTGFRPWQGTISDWDIGAGAVVNVSTNVACWAFWLQWDLTSAALANFVNVPGQGDFNTADPSASKFGNTLATCGATSTVAAFNETASAPNNGNMPGRNEVKVGWQGISGDWHRAGNPMVSVVVYGLRVVFTGVLHSWNQAGQDWLVRDDALNAKAACSLDHNSGALNAMLMRVK